MDVDKFEQADFDKLTAPENDDLSLKVVVPSEGVRLDAKGNFRLSLNPQIYIEACKQHAENLSAKDIVDSIERSYGVRIPFTTIASMEKVPRYARLIAYYRRHVGPLLRQIPGVSVVKRAKAASELMDDRDWRARATGIKLMNEIVSDASVKSMIEEYEGDEVPEAVMQERVIRVAIRLLDMNSIATQLSADMKTTILKTADKIKKFEVNVATIKEAQYTIEPPTEPRPTEPQPKEPESDNAEA